MSTLRQEIKAQEDLVARHKAEITEHWHSIKQNTLDKLTSTEALIWSAIGGFLVGKIFRPTRSNLMFALWPIIKNAGQPLFDKILHIINPESQHNENPDNRS